MNFRIFWDGNLQEELLDGTSIDRWNGSGTTRLYIRGKNPYDYGNSSSCNGTKNTPNLQADIFGDWREEIILWDKSDGATLNVFSSNEPTNYRVPTLMHDHTYRMGIAWQNVAYNQPPHLGYYLPDRYAPHAWIAEGTLMEQTVALDSEIVPIVIDYDANTKTIVADSIYTPTTKRRGLTSEFTRRNVTTERRMTITGTPSSLGDYTILVKAYNDLASRFDIIVIEGAGSPAEINLKDEDIVNMGMAKMADAPVLLVGDIDRGGVFAQLYGTVALLEPDERARIKGTIVNKFRGDVSILEPGIKQLEDLCGVPVAGVVPYLHVDIDDEDSLTERFHTGSQRKLIDVAVIRLPRISNFTDFSPFERYENVSLRYVGKTEDLKDPDLILLPGTKSTIADLLWLRQSGLEASILKAASGGVPVFGICGGFQMLGKRISDPQGVEAAGVTEIAGLGLLDTETVFYGEKVQTQTKGVLSGISGIFRGLNGLEYEGYEIHMGRGGEKGAPVVDKGTVYGSYVHGIFDKGGICDELLRALCARRGVDFAALGSFDANEYKERQYDLLADGVRSGLNMDFVYKVLNREV